MDTTQLQFVMVGLVPTITSSFRRAVFKTWMLATRASMTLSGRPSCSWVPGSSLREAPE
jgi:hypothetical protein